jgi:hypothetical protein
MKKNAWIIALASVVIFVAGCAGSPIDKKRANPKTSLLSANKKTLTLKTHSIVYHFASSPSVTEKRFTTKLTVNRRSEIASYKFENFVSGGKRADNIVLFATSGSSAGFGIHDWSGVPLIEYGTGKVVGSNTFFTREDKHGVYKVRWLVGDYSIVSIIDTYNVKNEMVHSEITTYSLTAD